MRAYSITKYKMAEYDNVELHLYQSFFNGHVEEYKLIVNGAESKEYLYILASLQNTKLGFINRFINSRLIHYRIKKLGGKLI